jgi:hypothetical protein
MRSAIATVSLIYLVIVSLFLSFQAIWVCDGYFPVGWNLRGLLIHIGMWTPPVCLLLGCIMLATHFRSETAIVLILAAILYFTGFTVLVLITSIGQVRSHQQSLWVYLWLVAPMSAAGAARSLYVWANELENPLHAR